ncbi:MAG: hypothetical protein IPK13_19195 [Deltaproteobacteria bacterium]|nr:hypothetical protein [Deltaproteobacteria bacterium]
MRNKAETIPKDIMKDLTLRSLGPTILLCLGLVPLTSGVAHATRADRTSSCAAASSKKAQVTTGIEWQIEPGEVVVHLDGKKVGLAKDLTVTATRPGKHVIQLVKGGDESEMEVKVTKGQLLKVVYSFSE